MDWKKTKIVTYRWDASGFTIIDNAEEPGRRFKLVDAAEPDDLPTYHAGLEDAKRHARMLNERQLLREENRRLRSELAQQRGQWPSEEEIARLDAEDTVIEHADAADERPVVDCGPDGRGVPKAFDPWFDRAPLLGAAPIANEDDDTPAASCRPDPATEAHKPGGIRETLHGMFG